MSANPNKKPNSIHTENNKKRINDFTSPGSKPQFVNFFKILWLNNKTLSTVLMLSLLLFFIPSTTLLGWFSLSILTAWYFSTTTLIKKSLGQINQKFAIIFGFILGFLTFSFILAIPAGAYMAATQPNSFKKEGAVAINNEVIKKELAEATKQAEDARKREESQRQKGIEAQEAKNKVYADKQKLEDQIAIATKINPEYDIGNDLESQSEEQVVSANASIANLGTNTKNQKLFDVISVVDGDTIKISELGTLRLIGMDTPETKDPRKPVQCFGVEASNRAKELLSGKKVYLEFDPANRIDKYKRTLAYVYTEDGYFFNKEMINDGYANSYVKFPHPKLDEFNKAQTEARENKRGLWSDSTCSGDTQKSALQPKLEPITVKKTTLTTTSKPPTPAPVTTTNTAPATQTTTQPVPAPTPTITPPITTNEIYYANCTAVRAAGKAPIYKDQPGYRAALDRDNDGMACDT